MDIESFRDYCLSKPSVTEETPFSRLPDVLVFKVGGKMFTGTDISKPLAFSIKCVPETIEELRSDYYAVNEPSYFSKKHWCNVDVDGSISDVVLRQWLDISYELVVSNLPTAVRNSIVS